MNKRSSLSALLLCGVILCASACTPQQNSVPVAPSIESAPESVITTDAPASRSYTTPKIDSKTEEIVMDCPFEKEGNWYLLNSASDLSELRKLLDQRAKFSDGTLAKEGKYRLTQPVDLTDQLDPQRGWIPIGSFLADETRTSRQWAAFSGQFDGGGHPITGLTIRNADLDTPHGLFGYTTDAILQNVVILNCDIISLSNVGAVAGQNTTSGRRETLLRDCVVTGQVIGTTLVGGVLGTGERIENCGFTGIVSGQYDEFFQSNAYGTGGVAGSVDKISSCYARATVSGFDGAGGVVGSSYRVKNCYFVGEVSGASSIGGIVGNSAVIQGCYTDADVYGFEAVGGIGGHVATTYNVEPEAINGLVSNVLAIGNAIHQTPNPDEHGNDFNWPVGRILGFVGAGIGADQMYASETMQMQFSTKTPQNSYFWDGDHFPAQYEQDPTAWQEILILQGERWENIWRWQDGETPRLVWEKPMTG